MAEIQYGTPDSSGDYPNSLGSPRPDPANRFFEYVPDYVVTGPRRTALDGTQHVFTLRADYTARLAIRHLPPSSLDEALALKVWLIEGGTVRVVTDDATSATYTATLKPGTTPEIVNEDDGRQHFAFRCELAKSTAILVDYR